MTWCSLMLTALLQEKDKKKRLDYLLKQSEQFAHFLTSGGAEQDTSNKAKKGPAAKEIYSSQQSVEYVFPFGYCFAMME